MSRIRTTTVGVIFSLLAQTAVAQGTESQIGRYLTTSGAPDSKVSFALLETIDARFPVPGTTVVQAVTHVLEGTGYALAPLDQLDPRSHAMLVSGIANSQRSLDQITRLSVLEALAGPGFDLVVDPISRRIAFDISIDELGKLGQ